MPKVSAKDLEASFPKQVAIFHKPCAFNPHGVSAAVCDRQTRVPIRNAQGCCKINCTSPRRMCRICLLQGGELKLVTNSEQGTCDEHAEVGTASMVQFSQRERLQTMPDSAPLAILSRRAKEFEPIREPGATEAFIPEHHIDFVARLSQEELSILRVLAQGGEYEIIARELNIPQVRVIGLLGTMSSKLSLRSIATTKRRAALVAVAQCFVQRETG